jgi:hypothetical protein
MHIVIAHSMGDTVTARRQAEELAWAEPAT